MDISKEDCTFIAAGIKSENVANIWMNQIEWAHFLCRFRKPGQYTVWMASPSGKLYALRTCISQSGLISVCFNDGQKLCMALRLNPEEVLNEINAKHITKDSP